MLLVDVSQSTLTRSHAVFHLFVDPAGGRGVPLCWSVNWEAVVRNADETGRTAISAAVAATTVLTSSLWEKVVVVASVRWMSKAVVHRLDLDENGVAAA